MTAAGPHYGASGVTVYAQAWPGISKKLLIVGVQEGALLLSPHHPAPFLVSQNLPTVSFNYVFSWRKMDVTHQLPTQPKPDNVLL